MDYDLQTSLPHAIRQPGKHDEWERLRRKAGDTSLPKAVDRSDVLRLLVNDNRLTQNQTDGDRALDHVLVPRIVLSMCILHLIPRIAIPSCAHAITSRTASPP